MLLQLLRWTQFRIEADINIGICGESIFGVEWTVEFVI